MHRFAYFASLALVGCIPDSGDEGLLILKNVAPAAGCELTADVSETGVSHGALSSTIPTQYQFIAQVKSKITATMSQIDQRTVSMTGANIELTFPDSDYFSAAELAAMETNGVTKFKSLFAASITPNGGISDAGFEITTRALYDAIYAKSPEAQIPFGEPRFALEIVAKIQILGEMAGDQVTSQPYSFPLRIANDEPLQIIGTCPVPADAEIITGNNCGRPQDVAISCCQDVASGSVMCPPPVAMALQAPVP